MNNYIIFTDYPINRLKEAFEIEGFLDYHINEPNIPFININPKTLYIDQNGNKSTIFINSNTSWSIVDDDIKKFNNYKNEKNYGKTSMANSNSWIWKW